MTFCFGVLYYEQLRTGQGNLDFSPEMWYNNNAIGMRTRRISNDGGTEENYRQPLVVGTREETPAVNRTLEQVAAYAGGNDGAGGTAQTLARLDKPAFAALLGYAAKQEGSFIGDLSKVADTGRIIGKGNESIVHPSREPGYVIKVNNFKLIDSEHSPLDFFEGIKAYNEFSPSTRLDIIGFTENDAGDVFAVMRQKHVAASRHATQPEIDAYLSKNGGFTVGRDRSQGNRIVHTSEDFTVLDAEPRNVLVGEDGELYFVDLIISRNRAGKQTLFSLAGIKGAERLGIGRLADAERMEKDGADRMAIWKQTGWWRAKDGKWRVEIPDIPNIFSQNVLVETAPEVKSAWDAYKKSLAEDPFSGETAENLEEYNETVRRFTARNRRFTLSEAIGESHPLLQAYPYLKYITVEIAELPEKALGYYDGRNHAIAITADNTVPNRAKYETLVHEIQHAIQAVEGFANGGSPTKIAKIVEKLNYYYGMVGTMLPYTGYDQWKRSLPTNRAVAARQTFQSGDPFSWVKAYLDSVPDSVFAGKADETSETELEAREYIRDAIRNFETLKATLPENGLPENDLSYPINPLDIYGRLAGEAEARLAMYRTRLPPEERASRPPWMYYDIMEEAQIVRGVREDKPAGDTLFSSGDIARQGDLFGELGGLASAQSPTFASTRATRTAQQQPPETPAQGEGGFALEADNAAPARRRSTNADMEAGAASEGARRDAEAVATARAIGIAGATRGQVAERRQQLGMLRELLSEARGFRTALADTKEGNTARMNTLNRRLAQTEEVIGLLKERFGLEGVSNDETAEGETGIDARIRGIAEALAWRDRQIDTEERDRAISDDVEGAAAAMPEIDTGRFGFREAALGFLTDLVDLAQSYREWVPPAQTGGESVEERRAKAHTPANNRKWLDSPFRKTWAIPEEEEGGDASRIPMAGVGAVSEDAADEATEERIAEEGKSARGGSSVADEANPELARRQLLADGANYQERKVGGKTGRARRRGLPGAGEDTRTVRDVLESLLRRAAARAAAARELQAIASDPKNSDSALPRALVLDALDFYRNIGSATQPSVGNLSGMSARAARERREKFVKEGRAKSIAQAQGAAWFLENGFPRKAKDGETARVTMADGRKYAVPVKNASTLTKVEAAALARLGESLEESANRSLSALTAMEGVRVRQRSAAGGLAEGQTLFSRGDIAAELAEAQRQYDAVVARYTNPDGSRKPGWMKAPNGKPTNLAERQWVQVRTPNFKRWFGDWEYARLLEMAERAWNDPQFKEKWAFVPSDALAKQLEATLGHPISQIVITADSVRHMKKHHGDAVAEKQRGQVAMTAEDALLIPYVLDNFDVAIRTPAQDMRDGEKAIEIYKQINGVAIVATIEQGKDKQFVVSGWKKMSAASMPSGNAASPRPNVLNAADKNRIAQEIAEVKRRARDASKVVDEDGEPMVVWHGSNHTHTVFDNRKSEYRNGTPDGVTFLTDSRNVASSYTPGGHGEDVVLDENGRPFVDVRFKDGHVERQFYDLGGVYATYLSLKNPMVVEASGAEWSKILFEGKQRTTNEIAKIARARGYDGVIFKGVIDGAMRNKPAPSTTFASFSPSQIKSADPVTYDDAGNVIPLSERFNPQNDDIRFSIVLPGPLLDRLDAEPTVKVYRAMQVIDGKLYPPMSARINKKMQLGIEFNSETGAVNNPAWYVSDEHPEALKRDKQGNIVMKPARNAEEFEHGVFRLDKAQKGQTNIDASYNPYWHASRTPLNDQFTSASERPELVTVECEIPASELTSAYRADYAKDSVGEKDWHSGPVSGWLAEYGIRRKVILSRYVKVLRVVPDSEVAATVRQMLGGTDISIPEGVVTPSLRAELERLGVDISRQNRAAYSWDKLAKDGKKPRTMAVPQFKSGAFRKNATHADMVAKGKDSVRRAGGRDTERGLALNIPAFGDVIVVGKSGLQHGLRPYDMNYGRLDNIDNADVLPVIGDILKNSVPVNEMRPREGEKTDGSTILIGAAFDERGKLVPILSIVNHIRDTNETPPIAVYPLKSINTQGRLENAFDTQNIKNALVQIRVSDLVEAVKDILPVFSKDVYDHFKQARPPSGDFSNDIRFSRGDILNRPADAVVQSIVDAHNASARGAAPAPGIMDRPETRLERFRRRNQDAMLPVKNWVDDLGGVSAKDNPYYAEDRRYGKDDHQTRELFRATVSPILDECDRRNVALSDLNYYLAAKFAGERNKMIADRTAGVKSDGSGLSDIEAAAILKKYRANGTEADLDAVAQMVWKMNRDTLDRLVDAGLLAKAQADAWKKLSPHYVPLRTMLENEDFDASEVSAAITKLESKHALGRSTVADSPFVFSILQAEQAIVRANKNEVRQKVAAIVRAHPETGRILVGQPLRRTLVRDTATGGYRVRYTVNRNFRERRAEKDTLGEDNVIQFKEDGELKYIVLNGERGKLVARAITKYGMEKIESSIGETARRFNRFLANTRTSWSPTFLLRNFGYDTQQVLVTMNMDGFHKESLLYGKYVASGSALRAAHDYYKYGTYDGELGWAMREFAENGGLIKGGTSQGWDETNDYIADELGGAETAAGRAKKAFIERFERYNSSIETQTRLAVYAALRRGGMGVEEAISYARDVTVNFNRKGERGQIINNWWMFANAGIQDMERIARSLFGNEARRHGKANGAIGSRAATIAAMLAFGIIQGLAGGDDDDDEMDNMTDYSKQSSWYRRIGKTPYYFRIGRRGPYNIIPYIGQRLTEVFLGKGKAEDAAADIAEYAWSLALDPTNSSQIMRADNGRSIDVVDTFANTVVPTLVAPLAQAATDRTFTGDELTLKRFNKNLPASHNGKEATSSLAKGVAKAVNSATGGDEYTAGLVDLPPEYYELFVSSILGSLGSDAVRTFGTTKDILAGDVNPERIPFVRDFVRKIPDNTRRYYEATTRQGGYETSAKGYRKDKDWAKVREFEEAHPSARPGVSKRLADMKKRIKELRDVEAHQEGDAQKRTHDLRTRMQGEYIRLLGD